MTPDEIMILLKFVSEHDIHRELWWRCDDEYAPITFFLNCNDMFYWGCSDCEELTVGDLGALEQAIKDADAICPIEGWGTAVFIARKRGMRPQKPAYPKDVKMWPLFDLCGPERDPSDESLFAPAIEKIINHYDNQTDEEAAAEDEAARGDEDESTDHT